MFVTYIEKYQNENSIVPLGFQLTIAPISASMGYLRVDLFFVVNCGLVSVLYSLNM